MIRIFAHSHTPYPTILYHKELHPGQPFSVANFLHPAKNTTFVPDNDINKNDQTNNCPHKVYIGCHIAVGGTARRRPPAAQARVPRRMAQYRLPRTICTAIHTRQSGILVPAARQVAQSRVQRCHLPSAPAVRRFLRI